MNPPRVARDTSLIGHLNSLFVPERFPDRTSQIPCFFRTGNCLLTIGKAQANGLDVFNGTLEEYRSNGLFDVVVSWDVWEHLTDPVGAVARVAELLAPGGLFCFTTVNMGGLGARLFRGRWPWFMRMHLHYFTRNSATAIVGRSGFDVLRLSTQPKTLKLGYLLDRSRGMFGPVARSARWAAERLRFASLPVRVDLGDILLLEARKNPQPDRNP